MHIWCHRNTHSHKNTYLQKKSSHTKTCRTDAQISISVERKLEDTRYESAPIRPVNAGDECGMSGRRGVGGVCGEGDVARQVGVVQVGVGFSDKGGAGCLLAPFNGGCGRYGEWLVLVADGEGMCDME